MSVDDVPAERCQNESSDASGKQHKANQAGSAGVQGDPRRQDDANADDKERPRGKLNNAKSVCCLHIQFASSHAPRGRYPLSL